METILLRENIHRNKKIFIYHYFRKESKSMKGHKNLAEKVHPGHLSCSAVTAYPTVFVLRLLIHGNGHCGERDVNHMTL